MKKIILFMFLSLILQCSVFGASNTATIDKIEKSIYGFTFPHDSETQRIDRIEEKVYGKITKDTNQARLAKLKKDLITDLIGQEITPKEDTFMENNDYITYENDPAEQLNMDYPAISELEKQVFGKENKGQDIKIRLSNLEQKTFNKTYTNEDLSTRTDRLKAQIMPQSFTSNGMRQQENSFYPDTPDKLTQNYHLNQYGSPYDFDYDYYNNMHRTYDDDDFITRQSIFHQNKKPLNLSSIEKTIYHKKFENEPTSQRLSRIESSVFGTNFPNDSETERIERISSAIQAQKSAKTYDSNKFSRNMATAFQIGTLILMVLACIL